MNSSAASVTPTPIATVRSTKTVSRKVSTSTPRSPASVRRSAMKRSYSLIPHATISSTAASAVIGTSASSLPATRMKISRNKAWKIPAMRRARAGADVGRGARDRARRGQSGEQGRGDDWRRPCPPAPAPNGAAVRSFRRPRSPRGALRSPRGTRSRTRSEAPRAPAQRTEARHVRERHSGGHRMEPVAHRLDWQM